jgi:hypothetical protein
VFLRALLISACVGAACVASATAVEAPTPEECSDLDDVLQTTVSGRPAVQGGDVEVTVARSEEQPTVAVEGLVVTANGDEVANLPVPVVGAPSRVAVTLPETRRVRLAIAWAQGPTLLGPACVGHDEYTLRALVSRERLARYLGRVGVAQRGWLRTRDANRACDRALDADNSATYVPTASCFEGVRRQDRSVRLYRAVEPPSGFETLHRGLVESAAIRSRTFAILANYLRRAAAVLGGAPLSLDDPDYPEGGGRRRAMWRNAVVAEARALKIAVPPWVRRVGT